jgi:circadian clock protein KaiB
MPSLTDGTDAMPPLCATPLRGAAESAAPPEMTYRFRLYVAGDAPNSAQARFNLNALCRARFAGDFEIEVVNVLREPVRALADRVRLTPTLIKLAPGPVKKIVGTLVDPQRVLKALGLPDRVP